MDKKTSQLLNRLTGQTNHIHLRWRSLLATSNPLAEEIIASITEENLTSIHDEQTIRLIQWKALLLRKTALFQLCHRQMDQLRGFKAFWERFFKLFLSLMLGLGIFANLSMLAWTLFILIQAPADDSLIFSNQLMSIWANCLILCICWRLLHRLWTTVAITVFDDPSSWYLYVLGLVLVVMSILASPAVLSSMVLSHSSPAAMLLRVSPLILPIFLFGDLSKAGFVPVHRPSTFFITLEIFLQFLVLTGLLISNSTSVLCILGTCWILRIIWHRWIRKQIYLPQTDSFLHTIVVVGKGMFAIVWGTALLLSIKMIRDMSLLPALSSLLMFIAWISILPWMGLLILYFRKRLPQDLGLQKSDSLRQTNNLVYQLSLFKSRGNYNSPLTKDWVWLFIFLRSVEDRGLFRTLEQEEFHSQLPLLLHYLQVWNCSYLHDQFSLFLEEWEILPGVSVTKNIFLAAHQSNPFPLLDLEDLLILQLPLLEWHLYHLFKAEYRSFPF